jgi:BirA family biotin operon repressor/biotin-[acetyl-CoA-carboxylase] ligase
MQTELAAALPGLRLQWLPEVDSTSSELRRRLAAGALETAVLLATDRQTQGRGTRGRDWVQGAAAAGLDLALTLAAPLHPAWQAEPRLSLLAGAAVSLAVERATGIPAGVKWANDLLLPVAAGQGWRKAGGILLETLAAPDGGRWLLCGVGVNVNSRAADYPPELAPRLTTIRDVLGQEADRTALHLAIAQGLSDLLLSPDPGLAATLLAAWHARDRTGATGYTLLREGRLTAVTAQGVDGPSGALRVRLPDGTTTLVQSYTELEAGAVG